MIVRSYKNADYGQVEKLIKQPQLYGGEFSLERDSFERLQNRILEDPESILVAENNHQIVGTISLIIDARVAWLYRFIVEANDITASKLLAEAAKVIAKKRGHSEILVYSDPNNSDLAARYKLLGFELGGTYVCYWTGT